MVIFLNKLHCFRRLDRSSRKWGYAHKSIRSIEWWESRVYFVSRQKKILALFLINTFIEIEAKRV
jgi:hypothetical protein